MKNQTDRLRNFTGLPVVSAVYFYFLIFAQFAFLHLAARHAFELQPIMACMGVAGIFGSLLAPTLIRRVGTLMPVQVGLAACTAAALAAPRAASLVLFCLLASVIGIALGLLTVACAGQLSLFFGRTRWGIKAGGVTGLAYAASNLPFIFTATPQTQAAWAAGACFVAFLLSFLLPAIPNEPEREHIPVFPLGLLAGIAVFLALVWLDSAAFFVIQETPELHRHTWGAGHLQISNALLHFGAACAAGWLLDRGLGRRVLVLGFLGLALGIGCLSSDGSFTGLAPVFYTAGVSFYSVALLLFPAIGMAGSDSLTRAAWVYAWAGWVASALGIGMAQHLHAVPPLFVLGAGLVILLNMGYLRLHFLRSHAWSFLGSLVLLLVFWQARQVQQDQKNWDEQNQTAVGRKVYISEGCMACHSQYVRPNGNDTLWWGPAASAAAALDNSPPLIGNRRQGPDLQNIGNRRSLTWNRLHLLHPRLLSPGSAMPSYAYLFTGEARRGRALLAYLQSLGEGTDRGTDNWYPASVTAASSDRTEFLYRQNCAVCHGNNGYGNGPLALQLDGAQPRNFHQESWRFAPDTLPPMQRSAARARLLKFGIPGTSMPGHETLSDADILGLVNLVERWQHPVHTDESLNR